MNNIKTLVLLAVAFAISGFADAMSFQQASEAAQEGFLFGICHGVIAPLALIVSLHNEDVAVYAIYNNGSWYNFGFLLGIFGFIKVIYSK